MDNAASARSNLLWLRTALALGIALRLVVFGFLRPINNDGHYPIVRYVVILGKVPPTNSYIDTDEMGRVYLDQSYQPPLYYVLAAPWELLGAIKAVQLFSVVLSCVNLYLLYRLLLDGRLIPL